MSLACDQNKSISTAVWNKSKKKILQSSVLLKIQINIYFKLNWAITDLSPTWGETSKVKILKLQSKQTCLDVKI